MYRTVQDLLPPEGAQCYSVCRAYLPVEVVHSTEVRNAHTNEVVDLWPTADHVTVKSRFEQAKCSLVATEHFARIKSSLGSIVIPLGIDKIVAFGCSTISSLKDDSVVSSMAQHSLALMIRDFLVDLYGEHSRTIQCYPENPFYAPIDNLVLSEAGFTIIDDLRAFLEVDETSVVIAMDPDIPVRQIVADTARPAMMVWNKVRVSEPFGTTILGI
ncbi:hypothetical protein NEMBOFW57_001209 [Staphylotrichum longicolle]|uniref:SRR1-like domain-containing protein n=1 Tax=Staphylotrichum longicolle TaxID=669026 RepID=A0AAD4I0L7_9PEZI|nr:hypothetical protein NEMBOFW57_001209 [Staphylotrichum longicolle]